MSKDDVLVRVENVSKKFCRSLKRSLWYGMQDLGNELRGRAHGGNGQLRQDEFWAVNNVSFELKRGKCLGLIGHNGAGKTTLLRMLNGLIKPDQGRIEMYGRVGALIALGAGFNPILTGRENIYVNASVLGLSGKDIDAKFDEIVEFADIGEFIDAPVQSYSSGMQVRLGFAVATALEPDVLILDEILAVGDAAFRAKCFNRIHQILQTAAVIFVSHNMAQVTRISDRILLMGGGRTLAHGHDLGTIIAQYHEAIDSSVTIVSHGTGEADLLSCGIEDVNGNKQACISHGSDFTIVLKLHLTESARSEPLRILIAVVDQEESNVAQISHEFSPNVLPLQATIRLQFRDAVLSAGRYSLAIGLLVGRRGRLGHMARNAMNFVVESPGSAFAPVSLRPASVLVAEQ